MPKTSDDFRLRASTASNRFVYYEDEIDWLVNYHYHSDGWTSRSIVSLSKNLEEVLCWIVQHVPPTTQLAKGLNWTEQSFAHKSGPFQLFTQPMKTGKYELLFIREDKTAYTFSLGLPLTSDKRNRSNRRLHDAWAFHTLRRACHLESGNPMLFGGIRAPNRDFIPGTVRGKGAAYRI